MSVDTHFCNTLFTSPIQPSLTYLWAQFRYCIIFYSFKYDPSPFDILGKLRKCRLKGMGRFPSNFLHEPNPCVLPSEKGILVVPQPYGGGLYLKFPHQKNFHTLADCGSKFLFEPIFSLKIVGLN